jgi:hypothetical protein
MSYREIDSVAMDPVEPMPVEVWTGMLTELSDEVLEELLHRAPRDGAAYLVLQVQHIGGGQRPGEDRAGLVHWTGEFLVHREVKDSPCTTVSPARWCSRPPGARPWGDRGAEVTGAARGSGWSALGHLGRTRPTKDL